MSEKKEEKQKPSAVDKRREKDKTSVLEQLKKLPIIQAACQKAGVGRASYYRWRIEDEVFVRESDQAISEGVEMINDLSENQLIMAIRDNNLSAVRFWLQNRHKAYANKLEVMERSKSDNQELTTEQKSIVEKALRLASVGKKENDHPNNMLKSENKK